MMRRLERVQELIHHQIGDLAARYVREAGTIVTFTRVEVAPNLRGARIFFVAYPSEKIPGVLVRLQKSAPFLQHELNKRLNMRPVPRIVFAIDRQEEEAAKVEDILRELEIDKKSK